MAVKLIWTPGAVRDLEQIHAYIAADAPRYAYGLANSGRASEYRWLTSVEPDRATDIIVRRLAPVVRFAQRRALGLLGVRQLDFRR